MPDRTINFGESEAEATYQIQDTDGAAGGGNFVVAKDTNANTVLLEYDPGTDTWEYAGDVDLNGGTLTAGSVNTEDETVNNQLTAPASLPSDETANRSIGTWYQNTTGSWLLAVVTIQADGDDIDMAVVSHVNDSQLNNPMDYATENGATASGANDRVSVIMWVPNGAYYRITEFADTSDFSLFEWNESTVGVA